MRKLITTSIGLTLMALMLTACAPTSTVDVLEDAVRESAAMDAMIPGTPPPTPRSF